MPWRTCFPQHVEKVVRCSTLRWIFQLVCKSLFLLSFGSSASIFYSRPRRIQAQVTRAAVESLKPHRFQRRNWPAQLYAMSPWISMATRHSRRGRLVVLSVKIAEKMEKPGRGHSTATPRNQMADATLTLHPGHTTEVGPSSNIWSNWYPKFLNTAVQLVVTR